jgi:hypothetical protein
VACIVLSARISDILEKIAPVIRMCILTCIHLIYFKNLLKMLFTLSLLIKIEIMLMSLTMPYQVLTKKDIHLGAKGLGN